MAYAGRLRLSGLKSKLMKDRYVVLSTVTMSSPNRTAKHKKTTRKKQPKHQNTTQTKHKTKNQPTRTKQQCDRYQFMGESGKLTQEVIALYHLSMVLGAPQYGSATKPNKNTQTTRPYQRVSEATKYHAETRDPPRQDPRDHMAQADKA